MNAARITVGLPVYNGAAVIHQSLDALQNQTCRDFVCLIYDNASTDGTSEICAKLAATDSRFIHHRNAENIGSAQNFLDVLAACETEYFLWRADDDFSSLNFLERMQAQLDAAPDAMLAACRVESRRPAKNRTKHASFVRNWPAPRIVNVLRRMFLCHPSWIYGMWRTDALRKVYLSTWEKYPTGWANDHFCILQTILAEAVVGDDGATFIQQIDVRGGAAAAPPPPKRTLSEEIAIKEPLYRTCSSLYRDLVGQHDWSAIEQLALKCAEGPWLSKRVKTSRGTLAWLKLRRSLMGGGR